MTASDPKPAPLQSETYVISKQYHWVENTCHMWCLTWIWSQRNHHLSPYQRRMFLQNPLLQTYHILQHNWQVVIWDVMSCNLVDFYQHFKGINCLPGCRFLQSVGYYKTSYPSRPVLIFTSVRTINSIKFILPPLMAMVSEYRLYSVRWYEDWWMINQKGFERKQLCPDRGTILALSWNIHSNY